MAFMIFQRGVLVGGEKNYHRTRKTEMANKYSMETEPVKYVEVTENLGKESTHTTPAHISLGQSAHNYRFVYNPV